MKKLSVAEKLPRIKLLLVIWLSLNPNLVYPHGADGELWALGSNFFGELGTGDQVDRTIPVRIDDQVRSVAAGDLASVFVKEDGTLWAMGSNHPDRFSSDPLDAFLSPTQIHSGIKMATTGLSNLFFIREDNTLWGTGAIYPGQASEPNPTLIDDSVMSVDTGLFYFHYIKQDQSLWAMGLNTFGNLGTGDTVHRTTPIQIDSGVVAVDGANYFTLYIKTDGTLWGTGDNGAGQLGTGNTIAVLSPIQIDTQVMAVSVGDGCSLYLKEDFSLWGMGSNQHGKLGIGDTNNRFSPTKIDTDVVSVAAGEDHNLYIKSDGTLWGMGLDGSGSLGLGDFASHSTPVLIDKNVVAASANHHTLYLKTFDLYDVTTSAFVGIRPIADNLEMSAQPSIGTAYFTFASEDLLGWDVEDELPKRANGERFSFVRALSESAVFYQVRLYPIYAPESIEEDFNTLSDLLFGSGGGLSEVIPIGPNLFEWNLTINDEFFDSSVKISMTIGYQVSEYNLNLVTTEMDFVKITESVLSTGEIVFDGSPEQFSETFETPTATSAILETEYFGEETGANAVEYLFTDGSRTSLKDSF